MSEITFENVLAQARQLPWEEQQKLLRALADETPPRPAGRRGRRVPPPVPYKDRSREFKWLREQGAAYVGQWVALEGDQLIASGASGVEAMAAARAQGVDRPLLVQVEPPDAYPFGFWR
jgi:hypothetical protein